MEQHWIALATTAENEILAWHTNLNILESACAGDFRAICKVFGVSADEYAKLKQGKLNYKLQYSSPRDTHFVEDTTRSEEITIVGQLLQGRVSLTLELHQRLEHGYKRFEPVVPWQAKAYQLKEEQARRALAGDTNDIEFIKDEQAIRKLPIETICNLIIAKADNDRYQIRKLERIRIKTQKAIRKLQTREDVSEIRATLAEESFLSMLM